jgi:hypothetical protein
MLRKLLLTLIVANGILLPALAQVGQGTIKGKITDDGGEPVPFANVTLYNGSDQILGTTTDFDGEYVLKPIPPGAYDLQVSYVGYQTKRITDVIVNSDKITKQDLAISQGIELKEVEVIAFNKPLIEIDKTTSEQTMTREEIEKMAIRSVGDISKTTGNGVFSRDNGSDALNVRGQRSNSSVTFIDGVKVIGSTELPKSAIQEVTVKTGGLSAQYGDVTGGVRTITTRGAFKEYFGSMEVLSSGFKTGEGTSFGLDHYGYNLFGFAAGGPIITKKDENGKIKDAPLGFLLTGEFRSILDPTPAAVTIRKPKDNVEKLVRENPLIYDEQLGAVVKRAELLTADDFEEIDYQFNANDKRYVVNGKFDIKISDLSTAAIGGTFDYLDNNVYSRNFSLYNYENNQNQQVTDFRIWGRYTQRFENAELEEGEVDNSVVKNAYFSIQADFSRRSGETMDRNHEDDFFRYGYIGRYTANTALSYTNINNPSDLVGVVLDDGNEYVGRFLTGFDAPISYDFEASDINPVLANYANNYYSFFEPGDIRYSSRLQVEGNGGLVNGSTVNGDIYQLWTAAGTPPNGYSKFENDQIRLTGTGSADIGDHAILLGFEYEQRIQRAYSLNPRDLWDLGRLSVNSHIEQIDSTSYSVQYVQPNASIPTITFERLYGGDAARTYFAYNVRKALGLDPSGTDYIDFDSYDYDLYSMNYFSADQLINPANNINLQYRGYDYQGRKLNASPSLDDFFNETNELGFKTRPVPAYQPIYIAGFIEDKFAFDDLVFRLGVRLDRFDANQPVLKDRYSFFPTRNVAYARSQGLSDVPSNINDNFVVYVADIENPSSENIVGYRDPESNVFYNASGEELNDPTVLQSGGTIAPWLEKPTARNTASDMGTESFKDYEPQYTLMPRISFSFPISDEATFFANYDILTRRPSSENILDPIDIIYVANHNRIINNPDLKPTKTISYEIGFKQKISRSSALTLSANYREQRDEIQVRKLVAAYPEDYLTYDNIDFGTVKGFSVNYDLRRTKNVALRINYTIQFAEGTGSGSTSALNLARADQPNLRTIFPYSYDQRHQIVTTFDYRYGQGRGYNGPTINGKDILQNTGLNVIFIAGSGTPYTARSLPGSSELMTGSATQQPVTGDINGSRLPWTLRMDVSLDKAIDIKWGSSTENNKALWKEGKKTSTLVLSLQVLNALNRQNVQGVYGYTGNANDDGYLSAPLFQDQIRQQISEQSYRDQYSFRLDNQFNYELPRRIRIGAQLTF